ncbi:ABC transporter substrate-binding protein [Oceaniglobus trochenteri]|uniref:ABC transporter substrate-binding protein n=1 Tax=Oceaniglobus trochenteri TaxID=2763260 RepID=UPI001D0010FE|nr:sugar ABC transporter substrate-binding protein [Oceaniglobus trochenteri]
MSNGFKGSRGPTRRGIIAAGAAAATVSGFPYINRMAHAQGAPLKFWQFYAPGGSVESQVNWFTQLVADWNASHEKQIELEYVPNTEYMNGTKLATSFASGEGPDIFIISPGDFLRYYNGGVLQDLTPHIDPAVQADYPAEVMASRKVDDKIYAIPMEVDPMAMYYSVKAFDDAGLNENDIPKTWDEFLELGKKLTNGDRFGAMFHTAPGYYQNFTWYPFLWQTGADFQKDGKSAFDSPGTVQALKFWQDAIETGIAPRQMLGGGANDLTANLASGYCAIQNCGVWGISQMRANAPDFEYGVFRLPVPEGGKYVTVGGGWAFAANSRGKDPETAAEFCAWALAAKDEASVQRGVDWVTKAKSNMPPRTSGFEVGGDLFQQGTLGTFANEIATSMRAEPRMPPQVYKIISDAIQAAQLGGQNPQDVASSASKQIDAFLASYRGAPIL